MSFWYWVTHQFTVEAGLNYRQWYLSLEKPFFTPAPEVFGIAWGLIYPLIAVAFLITIYLYRKGTISLSFLLLFAVNILLNLSFSPALLATKNNALASLVITLILGTLIYLQAWAYVQARIIFWILVPYLVWCAYATVLQISITALN